MLLYRACNEIEASQQKVGSPWVDNRPHFLITDRSVIFLTLFPELWRRVLNFGGRKRYPGVGCDVWGHTLLLDVPDEDLHKEIDGHYYLGVKYRCNLSQNIIVRGIAGPEWPLPDWVPQPLDEKDWQPASRNYEDRAIFYWTPRGVDPASLWYHPTTPLQQEHSSTWGQRKVQEGLAGPLFKFALFKSSH